jgi:hypothetical protein
MQSSSDLIQRLELLKFFAFKNQANLSIFSSTDSVANLKEV